MQCSVPSCENKSNSRKCDGITFHRLSGDAHVHAAWLRALGLQHAPLPDSALVCSLHFLRDDARETDSGSRQLLTDSVLSTVQVCMTCLNTDSKMCLMNKHKLEEAYEILTGYPMYDGGNLTQTLCVQCAHRLRSFSRFRHMSLRARSLMMELVKQHDVITDQHIMLLNSATNQLKRNLVSTTLRPDQCDLHIVHCDEDMQPLLEEALVGVKTEYSSDVSTTLGPDHCDLNIVHGNEDMQPLLEEARVGVKIECCDDVPTTLGPDHCDFNIVHCNEDTQPLLEKACVGVKKECCDDVPITLGPDHCDLHNVMHCNENTQFTVQENSVVVKNECSEDSKLVYDDKSLPIYEDYNNKSHVENPLKYESAPYLCRVCYKEFLHEHAYSTHVSMHQHGDVSSTFSACTNVAPVSSRLAASNENEAHATEEADATQHSERALVSNSGAADNRALDSDDRTRIRGCVVKLDDNLKSQEAVSTLRVELSTRKLQAVSSSGSVSARAAGDAAQCRAARAHDEPAAATRRTAASARTFNCDVCRRVFTREDKFVIHMKTHTGEKPFSCKICSFKCIQKGSLNRHIKTHTGEKPYSCRICGFKFTEKGTLVIHMRTHTGEKPYSCEICSYKCTVRSSLVTHMRTHTDERPFTCEICGYKFKRKCSLVNHMRIHTGEKPYSCEICRYKSAHKSSLMKHMRTHSDERPFICEICRYKFKHKNSLLNHVKIHTVC